MIEFELREYEYDDWLMDYDFTNLYVANYYGFKTNLNKRKKTWHPSSNFLAFFNDGELSRQWIGLGRKNPSPRKRLGTCKFLFGMSRTAHCESIKPKKLKKKFRFSAENSKSCEIFWVGTGKMLIWPRSSRISGWQVPSLESSWNLLQDTEIKKMYPCLLCWVIWGWKRRLRPDFSKFANFSLLFCNY